MSLIINPYIYVTVSGGVATITWNPTDKAGGISLSSDFMIAGRTGSTGYQSVRATKYWATGKHYFEAQVNAVSPASMMLGLARSSAVITNYVGSDVNGFGYNASNGGKYTNGSLTAFGGAWSASDVISGAYDADAGKIWFAKNNVWQGSGNPATGANPAFTVTAGSILAPMASIYEVTGQTFTGKFFLSNLVYAPPTGFTAWDDGSGNPVSITLNPADKAADLTLSTSDLVVTRDSTNGDNQRMVRATESRSAGKYCFAVESVVNTSDGQQVGLVDGAAGLNNYPGGVPNGYSVHNVNGRCYSNASVIGSDIGGISSGQYTTIAVDFDAGKIWVGRYVGSQIWSGDPAAGTGNRFSFTPNTSLFPAIALYRILHQSRACFKASHLPFTLPSGFSAWET